MRRPLRCRCVFCVRRALHLVEDWSIVIALGFFMGYVSS